MVESGISGPDRDRTDADYRITPTRNGWKAIIVLLGVFIAIGFITKVMI